MLRSCDVFFVADEEEEEKNSCASVWSCRTLSSRHNFNAAMNIITLSAQFEEPNFKSTQSRTTKPVQHWQILSFSFDTLFSLKELKNIKE